MRFRQQGHYILLGAVLLVLAAIACNLPGDNGGGSQATVAAVYSTITAQAGMSPMPSVTPPTEPSITSTPMTPTITPTPPNERTGNGQNLSIPRCSGTVSVDGNDNDWAGLSEWLTVYLDENVYGAGEWKGVDDLSGEGRMCWISSRLYLFIDVTDDVHVQTQQGASSWQGDQVEILFDSELREDFYETFWDTDDVQLGLSPGNFGDISAEVVQFHPRTLTNLSSVTMIAKQKEGGYVIEAGIAWSVLGITPTAGDRYGFCLAISDNDYPDTAQQNSMVSHCTKRRYDNPTSWITITLGS